MKHPTPEEWIEYLYPENPPFPALEVHLEECEICREQLKQWRSVKSSLDSWQLPKRRLQSRTFWGQRLRWAAAAVIFLSLGFYAHYWAAPASPNLQSLASSIEPMVLQSVQDSLNRQFREQWRSDLQIIQSQMDRQQVEFQQLVLTALRQSSTQTKRALSGILSAYQQERQQWAQALQTLQIQRESDQELFHHNLARLAVATGQEIQQAKAGIRALATTAQFDPEAADLPETINPQ